MQSWKNVPKCHQILLLEWNKITNQELKMRKNYMVMLVVFIMFGMFQGSLYSYVESQIEGVIVDDETGQPLKGAYIELISGLIDIESSTKDVLKFDFRKLEGVTYKIVANLPYNITSIFSWILGANTQLHNKQEEKQEEGGTSQPLQTFSLPS